jgi:hypothetical protein
MAIETRVPIPIQQQVVRLALAHPFTYRELARIIQTCDALTMDYRGMQRVLALHQLSPEVLRLQHHTLEQAPPPPLPSGQQLTLPLAPTTHAQR